MEMEKRLHMIVHLTLELWKLIGSHPQEKSDKYSIGMAGINQLYMSDRQPSIFRM